MIALSVLLLCAAGAPAALSQPHPGKPLFGLRPSLFGKTTLEEGHFQYAVKAGSSVQDAVEVINSGEQELELSLYAADMEQASDGALSPKDVTQKMTTVGTWISLERTRVAVPGRSSRFVSFTIDVPADLSPGDHVGAVVASAKTAVTPGGLNLESRVALIARVRVPGTPKLEAKIGTLRVQKGRDFDVKIENTGNLMLTAKGTIDISDGGRRVASVQLEPPDIYLIPGGTANFTATWHDAPMFGTRQAVVSLDTTSPKVPFERISGEPASVSYFDSRIVVLALLLAGALGLFLFAMRRRTATLPMTSTNRTATKADAMKG